MTPNPQDSAVALEVERAAFEAYIVGTLKIPAARDANGGYVLKEARTAWHVWLKARASQSDGTSGGWHTCEESSECTACDLQSPAGWRLVPVTPTKEMIEAAMHVKRVRLLEAVAQIRAGMDETEARTPAIVGEWEAMLAAAPSKSQGENHVG